MIFKIYDICKIHNPECIILENVSNLITIEKGECIKKIETLFNELDYNVTYKKLNSSNFGLAQSRERVYIICHKNKDVSFDNLEYCKNVSLNSIIDTNDITSNIETTFADKLIKLHKKCSVYNCKISDKRGGDNNIHSWDLEFNGSITERENQLMNKIMLERRKKHWAKSKNITWMDGMPLTFDEITTFFKDKTLQTMLDNLVEKNYLRLEKCKDLVNGKRIYKEDSEDGYNICKGKLSFPISKVLDPNLVSPTLTATDSHKLAIIINDNYIRKLNINELKKLCGFPESFIIPEDVNAYDLFGNMATPPVITSILTLIYY